MATHAQMKAEIKELRDALDRAADKPLRKVFFSKYSIFYVLVYTVAVGGFGFLLGSGI